MKSITQQMRGTDPIQTFDSVLRKAESLSFLRMGDGELRFLLECQDGNRSDDDYPIDSQPSLDSGVKGAAANRASDYGRILEAYENCDLLDLPLHIKFVRHRNPLELLKWNRRQDGWQSESIDDSRILPRWFLTHFHNYVTEHKCLFYGGESLLQEALLQDPDYKKYALAVWPDQHQADFLPLPNFGRYLSRDYNEMRESIASAIQRKNYDTIFIAASGLAKPLCVEIATTYRVKAIDIGSILRGMTYSATAGDATWPANHNPYYFSIPLSVYMKATRKAYPHLEPYELIAKANAQLCFDLTSGKPGTTVRRIFGSAHLDVHEENQKTFRENYNYYMKVLVPEFQGDKRVKKQVLDLHWWLKINGLNHLIPFGFHVALWVDRSKRLLRK